MEMKEEIFSLILLCSNVVRSAICISLVVVVAVVVVVAAVVVTTDDSDIQLKVTTQLQPLSFIDG